MNQISESIREFLKEEELEVFDNTQHQFAQLGNDEEVIVVLNFFGDENLYIQTGNDRAVLAFGHWRDEYDGSQEDIERLKKDVSDILENKSYVWTIFDTLSCIVGYVSDHVVHYLPCTNILGWEYMESQEFLSTIAKDEGQQSFLFWNPNKTNVEPRTFLM